MGTSTGLPAVIHFEEDLFEDVVRLLSFHEVPREAIIRIHAENVTVRNPLDGSAHERPRVSICMDSDTTSDDVVHEITLTSGSIVRVVCRTSDLRKFAAKPDGLKLKLDAAFLQVVKDAIRQRNADGR